MAGGFAGRDVHIDVPLSNVAIAYRPEGFIADQLFPIVSVKKQSDGYYVWDIADAYRRENALRAPGTEANVIERSVSSGTYFAKNYALKDRIPYEDIENADAGFIFVERGSRAEFIKDKLYLDWEYRVASTMTSGSNVGSYSAVASAWSDRANAAPVSDINTAIQVVEDMTGMRPNSIAFGRYAWRQFRESDQVIGRLFGDGTNGKDARVVNQAMVKSLFEVERVLIGGGYINSADEGQTETLAQIWNDNVVVYYAPLTPRKDKPSFAYSFRWDAVQGMNMQAEVFQLPRAKAEEVQLGYYQDEKVTAKKLAFLLTGVGSSQ